MTKVINKNETEFIKNSAFPLIRDMLNVIPNFRVKYYTHLNSDESPFSTIVTQCLLIDPVDDHSRNNVMNGTAVVVDTCGGKYRVHMHIDADEKYNDVRLERVNRLKKLFDTGRINNNYNLEVFTQSKKKRNEIKGIVIEFDEFDIFKIMDAIKYSCDVMDIIL